MSTMKPIASSSRQAYRHASTSASAGTPPPIRAAVLLSRPPLLTPPTHPLDSAYYAHTSSIRAALSNPVPTNFYFKPGSLPLRRFQQSQHARELETFGGRLAGKAPDVGDVPAEAPVEEIPRTHWEEQDGKRGESSLERFPTEEVFCLVQEKGKWVLPSTEVEAHEGLDEAVRRAILGKEGSMGGDGMDSWIVTRKPIAVSTVGSSKTFYLKSHILAGEPTPSNGASWAKTAWLNAKQVRERLEKQGEGKLWEELRGVFGEAGHAPSTEGEGSSSMHPL